jgi:hypothetical protein
MFDTSETNFIHHYLGIRREFYRDKEIRQSHVAIYEAIFLHWNEMRWNNPVSIIREEIMKVARVGSKNTFVRCMHELSRWGYFRYLPSSSSNVTSMVEVYPLEVIAANVQRRVKSGKGSEPRPVKSGNGGGTAPVPEVGPYITNNINNANNTNGVNTATPTEDKIEQENVRNAKTKAGRGTPESLEEVIAFFLSINSTESEAAHFFHHYNAVDWVKGNNLPVKNWHSTAEAWLRNSRRFKALQPGGPTPGSLQTPGTPGVTKNYNIKL